MTDFVCATYLRGCRSGPALQLRSSRSHRRSRGDSGGFSETLQRSVSRARRLRDRNRFVFAVLAGLLPGKRLEHFGARRADVLFVVKTFRSRAR